MWPPEPLLAQLWCTRDWRHCTMDQLPHDAGRQPTWGPTCVLWLSCPHLVRESRKTGNNHQHNHHTALQHTSQLTAHHQVLIEEKMSRHDSKLSTSSSSSIFPSPCLGVRMILIMAIFGFIWSKDWVNHTLLCSLIDGNIDWKIGLWIKTR